MQPWTARTSAARAADANRPASVAPIETLPALRRAAATLPAQPHVDHRRHPAAHQRTHASSRRLPQVKKACRAGRADALPNAAFGHRLISFTSWRHYGLGLTIEQLIDVLQFHLPTKLPSGGDSSQERSIEPLGARRADADLPPFYVPTVMRVRSSISSSGSPLSAEGKKPGSRGRAPGGVWGGAPRAASAAARPQVAAYAAGV